MQFLACFGNDKGKFSCTPSGLPLGFFLAIVIISDTSFERRNLAKIVRVSSVLFGSGFPILKQRRIAILAIVSTGMLRVYEECLDRVNYRISFSF